MDIYLNTDALDGTATFDIFSHYKDDGENVVADQVVSLLFGPASSGSDSYINVSGELGIGERSPTSKLEVNGSVEINSSYCYYLGDPGENDSWRIRINGGVLQFQKRIAGVWTTKGSFGP
jgi:hypothetical protein